MFVRSPIFLLVLCVVLFVVDAQTYNQSFTPWTVMGPVTTRASGNASLTYTGTGIDYEIYLSNLYGLKSIELHIAAPGTHGDVAAVFYAAGIATKEQVVNGLIAKGTLSGHDFLGPLLLPLGEHLDASFLHSRYVQTGNTVVVVHTLGNPGGELGAQLPASTARGPAAAGAAASSHNHMHGMAGMSGMEGMAGMQGMSAPAVAPVAVPSPAAGTDASMGNVPMGNMAMPAGGG